MRLVALVENRAGTPDSRLYFPGRPSKYCAHRERRIPNIRTQQPAKDSSLHIFSLVEKVDEQSFLGNIFLILGSAFLGNPKLARGEQKTALIVAVSILYPDSVVIRGSEAFLVFVVDNEKTTGHYFKHGEVPLVTEI
jgi:hypothetical protein